MRGIRGIGALAAAFLLAYSGSVRGEGEITRFEPFLHGDDLCVDLVARGLMDERTAMTIDSGLPGSCAFLLRVEARGPRVVAERLLERTLRFDLWENVYVLEQANVRRTFPTMASADSALFELDDFVLGPRTQLSVSEEYRVLVVIDVQPLAQEDRERLRRYVSRNSSGSGNSEELVLDLGAVLSKVFGKSSERRDTIVYETPFFRPSDLEVEP